MVCSIMMAKEDGLMQETSYWKPGIVFEPDIRQAFHHVALHQQA